MCNWNTKRRRQNGTKEIFEVIMAQKFSKLVTDTKPWIKEAQKTPRRISIYIKQKTKSKNHIHTHT